MSIPALDLWYSAVRAYKEWGERRAALMEIGALGRHEAERVLSECGLSHENFAAAMRRRLASAPLLSEAMRSVGVDPDAFETRHREWSQDLARTCTMCGVRRRCSDELASGSFAASYRHFCPNRDGIGELEKVWRTEANA